MRRSGHDVHTASSDGGRVTALIAGLVVFLGLHSTRIVADGARSRFIARYGAGPWRGLYSVVSVAGLALIVWGYGLTLQAPVVLRDPPHWVREVTAAINLPASILFIAAYVPRNHLKAWLGHPMVLGTALWAVAHIVAVRTAADVLVFMAFLVWAVACYLSLRARDRAAAVRPAAPQAARSALAVLIGMALWVVLGFWLHGPVIGIPALP
jgi:uncharacterized membrane protein